MLVTVAVSFWALTTPPQLLEAQRRKSCNARAAFTAAVSSPMLKDPSHSPLELASLIAAEEHHADSALSLPRHFSERIRSSIEQIVAPASKRIQLSRMMGNEVCMPLLDHSAQRRRRIELFWHVALRSKASH